MTEMHPGYGGPYVHKVKQDSPYDTLLEIIKTMREKNGGVMPSPSETESAFVSAMLADPDQADTCFKYAHANFRSAIERLFRENHVRQEASHVGSSVKSTTNLKQERRAARAATVNEILELPMPNGKRLGDCTFGEIAVIGGAFTRLAGKGKPNQLVRDVLSAGQVSAVFKKRGKK